MKFCIEAEASLQLTDSTAAHARQSTYPPSPHGWMDGWPAPVLPYQSILSRAVFLEETAGLTQCHASASASPLGETPVYGGLALDLLHLTKAWVAMRMVVMG